MNTNGIHKIGEEIKPILQYEPTDDQKERLFKIYEFLFNDLDVEENNGHN